ncbi:MAG: EF-hand domain-containing protein [Verrucomicrobiota bacterium]
MKKILILATVIVSGMALGLHAEEDGKGKGKGKGGDMEPGKRAEMMIEKLDTDGNGTISQSEFAAAPFAERLKDKEGALDKLFAARDGNGDGELDKKELSKPMKGGKGKGPGDGGKKGKGKKDAEEEDNS